MGVRILTLMSLVGFLLLSSCASAPPAEPSQSNAASVADNALNSTNTAAPKNYTIGSEDLLQIDVFQVEALSREVRVSAEGTITLPLIGTMQIAGLTAKEAEKLIAARLGERYLQHPQVTIFIKEFTSQRVTIEGLVKKPGVYPLKGPTTLLQALAMSEGPGDVANTEEVQVIHLNSQNRKEIHVYDVDAIREGAAEDPYVQRNDIVVVTEDGGKVFKKGAYQVFLRMMSSPFPFIF